MATSWASPRVTLKPCKQAASIIADKQLHALNSAQQQRSTPTPQFQAIHTPAVTNTSNANRTQQRNDKQSPASDKPPIPPRPGR